MNNIKITITKSNIAWFLYILGCLSAMIYTAYIFGLDGFFPTVIAEAFITAILLVG